jgi:DNA-binding transcriptional ArsR family regulator
MNPPPEEPEAVAALHKATSHRVRRHILLVMQEEDTPLAPIDYELRFHRLGGDEERRLSNISYHFRVLEDAGLVQLVETEPMRGSAKRYYRLSAAFTAELRDTVAMDEIAGLLEGEAVAGEDLLKRIAAIIVASGRPIR